MKLSVIFVILKKICTRFVRRAGLLASGRVSGRARARFGLKFVKIFRDDFEPTYKTFYDIQSNDFFFRSLHLLCLPRWFLWV